VTKRDDMWRHMTRRDDTWRNVSWWHVMTRDDTWWHVSWWHVMTSNDTWWQVMTRDDTWWHVTTGDETWHRIHRRVAEGGVMKSTGFPVRVPFKSDLLGENDNLSHNWWNFWIQHEILHKNKPIRSHFGEKNFLAIKTPMNYSSWVFSWKSLKIFFFKNQFVLCEI
jgi:hypothetical protein